MASAKALSLLVPRLKKYNRRKTLKPSEKSAITRREKQLKGVTHLFPITKKQARKLKGKTFLPGIQAIRLRGVSPNAKIKVNKTGDITIIDNGNEWIYWSLDREQVRSKRDMKKAGRDAFRKQFPIEIVSEMARKAFNKINVQGVSLWTHGGRSDAVFDDFRAFELWVNEKWSAGRYMRTDQNGELMDASDPGKWVSGIAILIENPEYTARRKALLQ